MANVIKLKRGSGSDPQASDLEVGELAIRTDQGKIFTKKDNGNVAEISGGGGVSDGDKGDITVSNSGDTFTIDDAAVTRTKLNLVSTSSNPGLEVKGDGTTDGNTNAGIGYVFGDGGLEKTFQDAFEIIIYTSNQLNDNAQIRGNQTAYYSIS